MIFEITQGKAKKINAKDFKNELELHQLIDKNLEVLFEIRYIKDEHRTQKHGRIETLGIDSSNRPVVIEYKRTMEKGQLSQANRYLVWIQENPAEFKLLVRKNLKIEAEIDFSNPRIICFAQEYDMDDKCLAPKLRAELWKYQYYENNTLVIESEQLPGQPINTKFKNYTVQKSKNSSKAKKQVKKTKTVEEHLHGASDELQRLFEEFNQRVFDLSSEIECYTTEANILYKTSVNFIELKVQRNRLRILLRTKDNQIDDPKHLTEIVPKSHGWGNLNRIVLIDPEEINTKFSLDDIMNLVIQSFKTTQ